MKSLFIFAMLMGCSDVAVPTDEPVVDQVGEAEEAGGASDLTMSVDAKSRYEISPYIYGFNHLAPKDPIPKGVTVSRLGGNNWSPYNCKNNATNAGVDYHHENNGFHGGGDVPGGAIFERSDLAFAAGAARVLLQVPMLEYVAADKLPGDVGSSPDYLSTRFRRNYHWWWEGADPAQTYQSDCLRLVTSRYGYEKFFFSLDNEPDIWADTHPRIAQKPTYAGYIERAKSYGSMVRAVGGASAKIFGPSLAGYMGYLSLNRASDANGRDFSDYFLAEMARYEREQGARILDAFDFHWYPEHRGTNGVRVIQDDDSEATVIARLEAPRSLWDPTFKENSWITNDVIKRPIRLLPEMREKIAANYPGTSVAITEYFYGGSNHISGAIAQADVLGVFGREGVFAANFWDLAYAGARYPLASIRLFSDYFGATGFKATTSDIAKSSIYASERNGELVLFVLNKSPNAQKAQISLTGVSPKAVVAALEVVQGVPDGRPAKASLMRSRVTATLSPRSITVIRLK